MEAKESRRVPPPPPPPGGGAKQQAQQGQGQQRELIDDIECKTWLDEIELSQYVETFTVNFSREGRFLSRKRLAQLRLQDFPKMNITNYEHQKILLEHIRMLLAIPYKDRVVRSPTRPITTKEQEPAESKEAKAKPEVKVSPRGVQANNSTIISGASEKKSTASNKKRAETFAKKRHSFDEKAWEAINKSRGISTNVQEEKEEKKQFVRRKSFDNNGGLDETNKGKIYGNMALQFNLLQNEIMQLQNSHLRKIKELIGCDIANILFVNDRSRELLLCIEGKWFRIPMESGLAGYCCLNGETLNIPDAYADRRFNSNIDKSTGYKTRNLLCCPVRNFRGGGRVVAVVELINKLGDKPFDENDEDVLIACVDKIIDELEGSFTELLKLNDSISAFASPILPMDNSITTIRRRNSGNKKGYEAETKSMIYRKNSKEQEDIEKEFRIASSLPESKEREVEKMKYVRRQSFGKALAAEIEANPELLHVRKN